MKVKLFAGMILLVALISAVTGNIFAQDDQDQDYKGPVFDRKELTALTELDKLYTSCEDYKQSHESYPQELSAFLDPNQDELSKELADGYSSVSGYTYIYNYMDIKRFEIYATSQPPQRNFYMDQTRTIRLNDKSGSVIQSW